MQSALYIGRVGHRRTKPIQNRFRHALFMVYLDLAELETIFSGRWFWSIGRRNIAWLRREDHFGDPTISLEQTVRDLVEKQSGKRPQGPVRMLTHLRYFGHCFNPVTFYYCFDKQDKELQTIIAEIHNTPWGQEHCYVLNKADNIGSPELMRFTFGKEFHISPFMPMDIKYDWEFNVPGDTLYVHMFDIMQGEKVFEAQLDLDRHTISGWNLAWSLLRFPLMTVKVISAIYWQALKLWVKGAPYYPHPELEE